MKNLADFLYLYFTKKLFVIFLMGIASGIPLYLILSTLAIWLTRSNIDISIVGLFSLTQLPWTIKFFWSPIFDYYRIPFFSKFIGNRKAWLFLIQLFLCLSILALGLSNPNDNLLPTAIFAFVVAFFSASQDIIIDAYRIELLDDDEQGAGAAMTQAGYRIGGIISGAGALYMREVITWSEVFLIVSLIILMFAIITLFLPRIKEINRKQNGFIITFFNPLIELIRRNNVKEFLIIILFILTFKLCDSVAGVMANPFYVKIGFENIEIANASKLFGVLATILGVFIGGLLVKKIGILKSLLLSAFLQMISNILFFVLSKIGPDYSFLIITVLGENISGGIGSASFVAYLSILCNRNFTATQYALLSSVMGVARTFIASPSGFVVEFLGWSNFFLISTLFAIPGLVILFWMEKKFPINKQISS
tara:strand:+ start:9694 stop:10959 length:1266 start_codon:yes stop_codon:yes gene_type:complete